MAFWPYLLDPSIFVYSTLMRGFQQRSRCLRVSGTSGGILKIPSSSIFSDEGCSGSLVAGISQNNIELQNDCIILFAGFVSKSDAIFYTFFFSFSLSSSNFA